MKESCKDDLIIEMCRNKEVLHVGATDTPYHLEKAKENRLLHQKLQDVCKELIGIDIDKKSIDDLKNFGIDIFYGNISSGKYGIDLKNRKFDYIILGDIIEHLDNPGLALENTKELMKKITKVIVTVPNVFSYNNFTTFFTGTEKVHSDHVFWPSYETMHRLFAAHSLKIHNFYYCFWGSSDQRTLKARLGYRLILKRKKYLLPCIMFVLKKRVL